MLPFSRGVAQAGLYLLFFVPLVYLTSAPAYEALPSGLAEIKLAVRHAGQIVGACTDLSSEQVAALPATMVRPQVCPRERSPLRLELTLDGELIFQDTISASGVHSDGVSSMYRRFTVPTGDHLLQLRMNDDVSVEGFNWTLEQDIHLAPAQVMVASFHDGFRLR